MKKQYIEPVSKVYYFGLQKGYATDIYDTTSGGADSDLARENNVWADDAPNDGSSTSDNKNLWDNQW